VPEHRKKYLRERKLPSPEGRAGRPKISYSLNTQSVATLPETAVALMELLKFPKDSTFRVRRDQFEEHMSKKFGLAPRLLRMCLRRAMKVGYIEVPSPGDIWPSELIASELLYLKLLSKEFKMPLSERLEPQSGKRRI
jgi:hypothetical protein